ncbi:hypothetical protein LPJ81_003370 [Coemansia sp. IMI 209127]|nr:hypothetical protein LPJ81_003370 [Coemansia sp. IMI 209127]
MNGISLSRRDRLLICLSVVLPPLATYLKFGQSRTLAANCLLTACLFIPGVIHAVKSIYDYPSVVFCGKKEARDGMAARDDSVIWEIPRNHFQSISGSIRVLESQSLATKSSGDSVQKMSVASLSQVSGCKSSLTVGKGSYCAHMDGNAPILNPSYGWGAIAAKEAMISEAKAVPVA